jgi:hypothetical protein
MPWPDSSTKLGTVVAEPLVGSVPDQRTLRPDDAVRSVEEFAEFLTELEAVFGPDDRFRRPTMGSRFLL